MTFIGPPVGRTAVGDFRIEAGTMKFYYMRQDFQYECTLQQQPPTFSTQLPSSSTMWGWCSLLRMETSVANSLSPCSASAPIFIT